MSKGSSFYSQLVGNPDELGPVADAFDYYMQQYTLGEAEVNTLMQRGKRLEEAARQLPGIVSHRYGQLQEIEQIIKYLEYREKHLLGKKRRMFREHYNRDLTDVMVERYAESDPELLDLAEVRNMFALVRNKFLGLTKHHECLHFQLTNMTKLRVAGIEDTVL
jgi:hypothetical protein